eukprot:6200055-Pleurochrysis_carterae.AAC.9
MQRRRPVCLIEQRVRVCAFALCSPAQGLFGPRDVCAPLRVARRRGPDQPAARHARAAHSAAPQGAHPRTRRTRMPSRTRVSVRTHADS